RSIATMNRYMFLCSINDDNEVSAARGEFKTTAQQWRLSGRRRHDQEGATVFDLIVGIKALAGVGIERQRHDSKITPLRRRLPLVRGGVQTQCLAAAQAGDIQFEANFGNENLA